MQRENSHFPRREGSSFSDLQLFWHVFSSWAKRAPPHPPVHQGSLCLLCILAFEQFFRFRRRFIVYPPYDPISSGLSVPLKSLFPFFIVSHFLLIPNLSSRFLSRMAILSIIFSSSVFYGISFSLRLLWNIVPFCLYCTTTTAKLSISIFSYIISFIFIYLLWQCT